MPSNNPWILHLQKVWKTEKPKGKSYKATMILAKKSYKKKGSSAEAAPKKRRRRKKKVLEGKRSRHPLSGESRSVMRDRPPVN